MAGHSHLPSEAHAFTERPDFTLILFDYQTETLTGANDKVANHYPVKQYDYRVSRAVLCRIPYFRPVLTPRSNFRWSDTGKDFHTLEEDDPTAWFVWLQILHGCPDKVERGSYGVHIATIWRMLIIADKYTISPRLAKDWFARWYDTWGDPESIDDCREALYPCHAFDHVKGFARATGFLAYEVVGGSVTEKRPDGVTVYHLRLENRIIQQVNAARGRLKTILHQGIYEPLTSMLNDERNHCPHKYKVVWDYLKSLEDTGAWPIDRAARSHSINELLSRLHGRFIWTDTHPDDSRCIYCKRAFAAVVREAVDTTRAYFNGLCLDCIYNPKTGDNDVDYHDYSHGKIPGTARGRSYNHGCRIKHGEPTWYFSFQSTQKDFDEWRFATEEAEEAKVEMEID